MKNFQTHIVYLLLGSNLGNKLSYLLKARNSINIQIGEIRKTSQVYETPPWGNTNQDNFYNQALEISTTLSPDKVLAEIHEIEGSFGRKRDNVSKWQPRTIDIDILFYDNIITNSPGLIIPHPFLHERKFALVPLQEIAPDLKHPVLGRTITQLNNSLSHSEIIKAVVC